MTYCVDEFFAVDHGTEGVEVVVILDDWYTRTPIHPKAVPHFTWANLCELGMALLGQLLEERSGATKPALARPRGE